MLATLFFMSVFYTGYCQILPDHPELDNQVIQCVTGVLTNYFTKQSEFTYVNMDTADEELLKAIHSTQAFSLVTRNSTHQSFFPNQAYVVTSKNVETFRKYFLYLMTDPLWNPYGRFLIIIESVQDNELRQIFDELLRTHVINVLVVNGTVDAHLYTYNPYDNYTCGKYYNDIISFGQCSQATQDLYPFKLVNGLKNCTFKASLAHRPPFSMDPSKMEAKKTLLGTEEYIFKILSEKEQFKVINNYSYNADLYSTVLPNMTAVGPMLMLQNNETDVIYGGMMMVSTRAQALSYLCGYHDYNDELRFIVKRASLVPIWKTVYIEFHSTVWLLLLLSIIVYSIMMIYLLQAKDKGLVPLELLDNLLVHGRHIRCRMTIKCILIIWVWFAYLINTFYQSSLVSLTTNPSKEYQVSDEEGIVKYNFEPCFSPALKKFLLTETKNTSHKRSGQSGIGRAGCNTTVESIRTVSTSPNMYGIVPNYAYLYYIKNFTDKWGKPLIYYFEKPYAKFLFGFYFYKGFPISHHLQLNSIRMRENGLADKSLKDIYYARTLKQRFFQKEFEVRFALPWGVYVIGCVVSIVTFIMEIIPKHRVQQLGNYLSGTRL